MPNQNTVAANSPEPMYHQIISTYLDNRSVTDTAAKCKTSPVKVRKVLITERLWSSRTSIEVQHYLNLGKRTAQIAAILCTTEKAVQQFLIRADCMGEKTPASRRSTVRTIESEYALLRPMC